MSKHKLKMCGPDNMVYGGKCVTKSDINDLWNLYTEVHCNFNLQIHKQ